MSDDDSREMDFADSASPPGVELIDEGAQLSDSAEDSPPINDDNIAAESATVDGEVFSKNREEQPALSDKEDDSSVEVIANDSELEAVIAAYQRKRKEAERKRSTNASVKVDAKVTKKNASPHGSQSSTSKYKLTTSKSEDISTSSSTVAKTAGRSKGPAKVKASNAEQSTTKVSVDRQPKKIHVEQTTKPKNRAAEVIHDAATPSPSKKQRSCTLAESHKVIATSSCTETKGKSVCENIVVEPSSSAVIENAPVSSIVNVDVTNSWIQILATDFKCDDYKSLLMKNEFSAKQACALQQSLINVCKKIESTYKCNDRFMKTHKCVECEFSISHQCMSVEYLQYVPSAIDLTEIGSITPKDTFMCICKFGFYHGHPIGKSVELMNRLSTKNVVRLLEHNRTVKVSCPRCRMSIVMRSRNAEVCCEFSQWQSLDGANRKTFFSAIENRLGNCKNNRPYMDELYTCNRQCCLVFHRCKSPQDQGDKDLANSSMK